MNGSNNRREHRYHRSVETIRTNGTRLALEADQKACVAGQICGTLMLMNADICERIERLSQQMDEMKLG